MALLSSVITNVKVYDESTDSYGEEIYFANSQSDALSGGTLTGDLNTLNIYPAATGTYNLGSSSLRYKYLYVQYINASGNIAASGQLSGATLSISGTSTLSGAVAAKSTLTVSGATTLNSALTVSGDTIMSSDLTVKGDISVHDLNVTNNTIMTGVVSFGSSATFADNLYVESHIRKQSAPYSDIDFDSSSTFAIGLRQDDNFTKWRAYLQFSSDNNFTVISDNFTIDKVFDGHFSSGSFYLQSPELSYITVTDGFAIYSTEGPIILDNYSKNANKNNRYDIQLLPMGNITATTHYGDINLIAKLNYKEDNNSLINDGIFLKVTNDTYSTFSRLSLDGESDGTFVSEFGDNQNYIHFDSNSSNRIAIYLDGERVIYTTAGEEHFLRFVNIQGFRVTTSDEIVFTAGDHLTVHTDNSIYLFPADTFDIDGNITDTGYTYSHSFVPYTSEIYNLGTNDLYWKKSYVQQIYVDSLDSGQTDYIILMGSEGIFADNTLYIGSNIVGVNISASNLDTKNPISDSGSIIWQITSKGAAYFTAVYVNGTQIA